MFKDAPIYHLKCQVFNKNDEICKETGTYDSYRKKKQAIGTYFEKVQMLNIADTDFKESILLYFFQRIYLKYIQTTKGNHTKKEGLMTLPQQIHCLNKGDNGITHLM